MGVSRSDRVRGEIKGLCSDGLDWIELSEALSHQVAQVVPFDGACWHTMDPATMLITGNAIQNLPPGGLPLLAACEYGAEDVNKWRYLAEQRSPAARLGEATQGQPSLSNRYRSLLRPGGIERELRVSFVDSAACWGAAGLYRLADSRDFTEEEEEFLGVVGHLIAEGYRRALVLDQLEDVHPSQGPGMLVIDSKNEIQAISEAAEAWLERLPLESDTDSGLPLPVLALGARIRGRDAGAESLDASVRIRTPDGEWLLMRATALSGGSKDLLGITVESASPPAIAGLLLAGYGLSQREREVSFAVLRGEPTREIAEGLSISPHTIQDHLKAIFEKVGVRSRRELVSLIYTEHYLPHVADGDTPTPAGWFGTDHKPTLISSPG